MHARKRPLLALLTAVTLALTTVVAASAATSDAVDAAPDTAQADFYVSVEVEGFDRIDFDQVILIGSRAKIEVGSPDPAVMLARPLRGVDDVHDWHELVKTGDPGATKQVTFVLYDDRGQPIAAYELTDGYPSRIRLEGDVETVTFSGEAIQRLRL